MDEQLEAAVKLALGADPRLASRALVVRVADGVACLTGTVGSWAAKMAAQDAARRVPGIAGVRNGIEFPRGEGARHSDADVARAVRQVLEQQRSGPEPGVLCTVSAGWVTLEGMVPDWKQRATLERVVEALPGVLGVANQIVLQGWAAGTGRPARGGREA